VLSFQGYDGQANLAQEEQLFKLARSSQQAFCAFYTNDPCVVLGRSNDPAKWLDSAQLDADGIPIYRRFTGGGAVYHDRNNLNFSFIMPKTILEGLADCPLRGAVSPSWYIEVFRKIVIQALRQGGTGYTATGTSDISLYGRKISGSAQRIADKAVLHHGTILKDCDLAAMERYLLIPPDRSGVPHRQFVTSLHKQGRNYPDDMLKTWIVKALCAGLSLTEAITPPEKGNNSYRERELRSKRD